MLDVNSDLFDYLSYRELLALQQIFPSDSQEYLYIQQYIQQCYNVRLIVKVFKKIIFLKKMSQDDSEFWEEIMENHILMKRWNPIHYFFHYPKQYIGSWYINKNNWKDEILNRYSRKTTHDPSCVTRLDLYQLQRQMTFDEMMNIGY